VSWCSGASRAPTRPTHPWEAPGGGKPAANGYDTFSETWVFDPFGERWSQLSFEGPTPRAEIAEQFADHEAADLFVLYGGFTLNDFRVLDDTWHLDLVAGNWERAEPVDPPPGRNYNAFGYEPSTELVVVSGGLMEGLDETWAYDLKALRWTFMGRRAGLPEVPYARFAYVEELDALLRLGELGPDSGTVLRNDVASNARSVVAAVNDGPNVSRHALSAVPGVGLVVFGGLPVESQGFTNALWVFDPAVGSWQQR